MAPRHVKVFAAFVALCWCLSVDGGPVSVMQGDLCRKMNGRKYYLEPDTRAVIVATNVTLPTFPEIASVQQAKKGPFHHGTRRHRREGPQKIGLLMEPRFRRNRTSLTLSSLPSSLMVGKTSFVQPPESARILTPLRAPTLEEHIPDPADAPEEVLSTPSPGLMEEPEEELEEVPEVKTTLTQPIKCGVEILTRPDSHLELTFDKVNLPSCSHDKSCRCDYLRLREPPYRGLGGLDICSMGDETPETFTSQTKEVRMDFLYTRAYEDALAIGVTAKRNKYLILGKVNSTLGHIRSPFFPELYPKDHWMEYDLVAKEENTRIRVTFLDFQLSPWSFVEVQDTNNSRVAVFTGNMFRPPVLVSSGPHLTVRFNGNGETARGFNMEYAFIDEESNAMIPPITDCGGYVTNFGGTITMMNMSKDSNYTMFDCVWIVQPPQNYAFKSHLSIKVVQYEKMASATTLEIRQGMTSDDYLLERIEGGDQKRTQEHVVAVDTGFYVRLRGFFNKDSKLAIVYSSFSYLGSCYSLTDLMCHNHRCIPKMLRCDGFDHCGDNSDEPTSCYSGADSKGLTPEDAAWWYQHTPNYYFPPKTSFLGGQHGWSGVLLLTSLIIMVILMISLLGYMFKQSAERIGVERRTHARRTSIGEDVEVVDASADDPPLYEPPPDYEDVIKFILSGNNLKLVRRPGGLTAWVPNKLAEEGADGNGQRKNDRPVRTRHASLDLERGVEVVLWNSNSEATPRNATNNEEAVASESNESASSPSSVLPFRLGHIRRSSLPTAPTPEIMHHSVQGHSVSIAPETIPEGPESLESPRLSIRHSHTLSSPQISVRSFNYDTSVVSSPGPSTPQPLRSSPKIRKSKLTKKGGKRKKSSAGRKPNHQSTTKDESAPPSYEDAMQQAIQSESRSITPFEEGHSSSDVANQVNESTQTSIDQGLMMDTEDLSPTDRVHAAREMFQKLSKVDQKNPNKQEAHGSHHVAKRPAVQVKRTRLHNHKGTTSGGTITRGTVKARKAMLLKSQNAKRECDCNGACSCAHFKQESPAEETPHKGGVKSKVQYYLNIEEGSKKRDSDSPTAESPTEETPQSPDVYPVASDTYNASPRKRKLVRNKSAPTIGRIRDLDLDIYFSQNEAVPGSSTPSPSEDMERPLITPVEESSGTIFDFPKTTDDQSELPRGEGIQSIQNRVKHYNDLTKSKTPSPLPQKTPSPLTSPIQGMKANRFVRADSTESVDEGNESSLFHMCSMKATSCDSSIKPGLVKEATAKFITNLATDIRPKLRQHSSDDWNENIDSPPPVRVPYLNLKNEPSSSPDIYEPESLKIPPLKKEEAESIELWDSISQGKSAAEEAIKDAKTGAVPSASSGAVPKKSVEVTIKLSKRTSDKPKSKGSKSQESKPVTVTSGGEGKVDLDSMQQEAITPPQEKVDLTSIKKSDAEKPKPCSPRLVLEEINLTPKAPNYICNSDDESLPPSPSRKGINDTLNDTMDTEIEFEVIPKSSLESAGAFSSKPEQPQEDSAKRKCPIPSPRGSKTLPLKVATGHEESSAPDKTSPAGSSAKMEVTPVSVLPPPVVKSENESPSDSNPAPSVSQTPRATTPVLSPQMEKCGVVTINTSKRLRRDYI